MAKVTSKLQVTIPKRIADQYSIAPGDDIDFVPAGDGIRIVTARRRPGRITVAERLRLFRAASDRQRQREMAMKPLSEASTDRGWTREDLYHRGKSR